MRQDVTAEGKIGRVGNASESDVLQSWKEIAAFLGKDVRTAMRWAKEQGMPVRRVPGAKRSRVYASKTEISDWLAGEQPESSPITDHVADIPFEPKTEARNSVSRRGLVVVAGALLAGAAFTGYRLFHREANPERAVLTGSLLTVLDGLGRTLWTKRFDKRFRPQLGQDTWDVQILDLTGEGRPGVLVTCNFFSYGSLEGDGDDGTLFYFSPDGRLRWTVPANPQLLDYTGQPFESAWNFSHVIAIPTKAGYEIWASVRHGIFWPGCILRIDAHGRSLVHFANSGQVNRLCYLGRQNTQLVAFSAENNELSRGAIGVFALDDAPASSPVGGPPRFRYANAPAGQPRDYALFPTSELAVARQIPYSHAGEIYSNPHGMLIEMTNGDGSYLRYGLSDRLEPEYVIPCDSYPMIHREFEQKGMVHHSWKDCPELKSPLVVRRFERGAGWRNFTVPWRLPANPA
jgi:hypothetical protein